MRIAFDLDDTLIETTVRFAVGTEENPWWCRCFFREKLRKGTRQLLKEFKQHHEVWIYTNSLRRVWVLKLWFLALGIRLDGVINQEIHDRKVEHTASEMRFSKMPPLFGIELLIDDSHGVLSECREQKSYCLDIDPDDRNWDVSLKKHLLIQRFILLGMTRSEKNNSVSLDCETMQGLRQFKIPFSTSTLSDSSGHQKNISVASFPKELQYLVMPPRSHEFRRILFAFHAGQDFEFPIDLSKL